MFNKKIKNKEQGKKNIYEIKNKKQSNSFIDEKKSQKNDYIPNFTMLKAKEQSKLNSRRISISMIIFIIIILFLTGYSLGKSITEVILNAKAEVAKPVLEVISNPEIDVTATNNIGEYEFRVLNYKNEEISEIDLRYFVEIEANVDNSIRFYLYKNGKELNLNNLRSEYMVLNKNKRCEDKFLLKVVYTNSGVTNMKDILEKVQVKVYSEQQKN